MKRPPVPRYGAAALALLAPAGCARVTAQPRAIAAPIAVETFSVQKRSLPDTEIVTGEIAPYRVATITAQVAETITRLPIAAGDAVPKGGILAQLDATTAAAQAAQARAGLAQATATRHQLEAEYRRAAIETDAQTQAADAAVRQATAGSRAAAAQEAQAVEVDLKARATTRAQELAAAEAQRAQTAAEETLAVADFDRAALLLREGAIAPQALDRARAALDAARARREAADQNVSLAREGARAEDIRAAAAGVAQARAGVSASTAQQDAARAQRRIAGTRPARLAALRAQIASSAAQEAGAAATLRQAQIVYDKHRIVAPFAGRVLARLTESGQSVAPGTPIARIGEVTHVKATFAVPEIARLALRPGQGVSVTVDALPGRRFLGTIETTSFQADTRTRTFPVEVRIANPDEALLPSMVARLSLAAPRTALAIPISAVATDGDTRFVYTIAGGRAQRRPVTVGAVVGERVIVTRGLAQGETIATVPQRLTDGTPVQTQPEGPR